MTLQQEAQRLRQLADDYQRETTALAARVEEQAVLVLSDLFPSLTSDTAGASAQRIAESLRRLGYRLRVLGEDDRNPIPGGVGSLDTPGLVIEGTAEHPAFTPATREQVRADDPPPEGEPIPA